jgi:hypothetical protein
MQVAEGLFERCNRGQGRGHLQLSRFQQALRHAADWTGDDLLEGPLRSLLQPSDRGRSSSLGARLWLGDAWLACCRELYTKPYLLFRDVPLRERRRNVDDARAIVRRAVRDAQRGDTSPHEERCLRHNGRRVGDAQRGDTSMSDRERSLSIWAEPPEGSRDPHEEMCLRHNGRRVGDAQRGDAQSSGMQTDTAVHSQVGTPEGSESSIISTEGTVVEDAPSEEEGEEAPSSSGEEDAMDTRSDPPQPDLQPYPSPPREGASCAADMDVDVDHREHHGGLEEAGLDHGGMEEAGLDHGGLDQALDELSVHIQDPGAPAVVKVTSAASSGGARGQVTRTKSLSKRVQHKLRDSLRDSRRDSRRDQFFL